MTSEKVELDFAEVLQPQSGMSTRKAANFRQTLMPFTTTWTEGFRFFFSSNNNVEAAQNRNDGLWIPLNRIPLEKIIMVAFMLVAFISPSYKVHLEKKG